MPMCFTMALACATYGSGVDPCATRLGKRRLAGLTLNRLRQISCECRGCRGYFAVGAWYVFVRISFCRVFEISTQELHYGEESKEKESEEEEVIFCLGVAIAMHEMGGWTCPAAFCLPDRHRDGHLGLSPISALIRLISASSLAPIAADQQRMAVPSGTPICAPRAGGIHALNSPR